MLRDKRRKKNRRESIRSFKDGKEKNVEQEKMRWTPEDEMDPRPHSNSQKYFIWKTVFLHTPNPRV